MSSRVRLWKVARSRRTEDYYSYGAGQKVTVRRIADKSTIYALYVAAAAGSPEKGVMNFYRTERSLLTTDTQYLLAGSFALSGDDQKAKDAGATAYMAKPYSPRELLQMIRKLLVCGQLRFDDGWRDGFTIAGEESPMHARP